MDGWIWIDVDHDRWLFLMISPDHDSFCLIKFRWMIRFNSWQRFTIWDYTQQQPGQCHQIHAKTLVGERSDNSYSIHCLNGDQGYRFLSLSRMNNSGFQLCCRSTCWGIEHSKSIFSHGHWSTQFTTINQQESRPSNIATRQKCLFMRVFTDDLLTHRTDGVPR